MVNTETKLHIYESECRTIAACTFQFPNTETGGNLYGTFTHGGMPVIWLASGPGPKARRDRTRFEQDAAFMTKWEQQLNSQFGLQYVGSWHSHHRIGLRHPSSGDVAAAQNYARNHHRHRTVEIIATFEGHHVALWPHYYADAQTRGPADAVFAQIPGISPVRVLLGSEELTFSGGVEWQKDVQAPILGSWDNPSGSSTDGDLLEIPDSLSSEIESIADTIIDMDQRGQVLAISVDAGQNQQVVIQVELRSVSIIAIELIDAATGVRRDMRESIAPRRLPLAMRKYGSGVLRELVQSLYAKRGASVIWHPTQTDVSDTSPLTEEDNVVAGTSDNLPGGNLEPPLVLSIGAEPRNEHTPDMFRVSATVQGRRESDHLLAILSKLEDAADSLSIPADGYLIQVRSNIKLGQLEDFLDIVREEFGGASITIDEEVEMRLEAEAAKPHDSSSNIFKRLLMKLRPS